MRHYQVRAQHQISDVQADHGVRHFIKRPLHQRLGEGETREELGGDACLVELLRRGSLTIESEDAGIHLSRGLITDTNHV